MNEERKERKLWVEMVEDNNYKSDNYIEKFEKYDMKHKIKTYHKRGKKSIPVSLFEHFNTFQPNFIFVNYSTKYMYILCII